MKKIYIILAILATVGMFCSCQKGGKGGKGGNGGNGGDAVAITIDGEFNDWTNTSIATAEVDENEAGYPYLHVMKVAADEDNLYFYFEYEVVEDQVKSALDIFIDNDHNPLTGFISWIWDKGGCGWDYLIESEAGFLKTTYDADGNATGFDGIREMDDAIIYWAEAYTNPTTGEQGDAWDAGSVQTPLTSKDFTETKGKVVDGIAYFEMSVPRSVVNCTRGGYIGVGVTVTNVVMPGGDWVTAGILPNEGGVGQDSFLDVQLP
ncbi:MAG: hypothetical protein J5769_01335 [Bacteroidales bacterium]|nr:hypothetical protein [Bacteroidales bacterium]